MILIIGKQYQTPNGILTYVGKYLAYNERHTLYEFCANWEDYQEGNAGRFYHYDSECVRAVLPAK